MKDVKSVLKRAIEKGDLKEKVFCSLIMTAGYSNWELSTLEVRYRNFLTLKRKYGDVIKKADYQNELAKIKPVINDNVFICWLQGWSGGGAACS